MRASTRSKCWTKVQARSGANSAYTNPLVKVEQRGAVPVFTSNRARTLPRVAGCVGWGHMPGVTVLTSPDLSFRFRSIHSASLSEHLLAVVWRRRDLSVE